MIFFGAGASAPFKIPTSSELTDIIIDHVKDENAKLFEDISYWLNTYFGYVDFENILKILYVLTDENNIRPDDRVHQFRTGYGHQGDYTDTINFMYNHIREECTNPFNSSSSKYLSVHELETVFNHTYDPILGTHLQAGSAEIVFSTNYDPTVEFWCEKRDILCLDGRTNTHNPEFSALNASNYFLRTFTNQTFGIRGNPALNDRFPLVRLHGSVLGYQTKKGNNIKFNSVRNDLKYPDLYKDFIDSQPVLIFPGYEDNVRRSHWDSLHRFFEDQLRNRCLFIGYSFRHDAINGPIIDNLINGSITKLGVFTPDPEKNLANLYRDSRAQEIPKDSIIKIRGKFGTKDGLKEYFNKWWSDDYSSMDVFNNNYRNWITFRNERYQ